MRLELIKKSISLCTALSFQKQQSISFNSIISAVYQDMLKLHSMAVDIHFSIIEIYIVYIMMGIINYDAIHRYITYQP